MKYYLLLISLLVFIGCQRPFISNPSVEDLNYLKNLRTQGMTPFGACHVMSWRDVDGKFSEEKVKEKLQLAKDIGIQWNRGGVEAHWMELETPYRINELKRAIGLLKEHDINSIFLYMPLPPKRLWSKEVFLLWEEVERGKINPGSFTSKAWSLYATNEWWDEWEKFNYNLAKTFNNIDYFEFWNEPNNTASGKCPPELYSKLLQKASKGLKSSRKNVKLIFGGIGRENYVYWLREVHKDLNIMNSYDILAIHPYDGEIFIQNCLKIVPNKEVWLTEDGYDANSFPLNLEFQANALRGCYLVYLKKYPRIKKIFW